MEDVLTKEGISPLALSSLTAFLRASPLRAFFSSVGNERIRTDAIMAALSTDECACNDCIIKQL